MILTTFLNTYTYILADGKTKAVRSGAIKVILEAIRKHVSDSSLCEHGCEVLGRITDYNRKITLFIKNTTWFKQSQFR